LGGGKNRVKTQRLFEKGKNRVGENKGEGKKLCSLKKNKNGVVIEKGDEKQKRPSTKSGYRTAGKKEKYLIGENNNVFVRSWKAKKK